MDLQTGLRRTVAEFVYISRSKLQEAVGDEVAMTLVESQAGTLSQEVPVGHRRKVTRRKHDQMVKVNRAKVLKALTDKSKLSNEASIRKIKFERQNTPIPPPTSPQE